MEIKNKMKMIIWDMDDTFWNGTLSEGYIVIPPDHVDIIKELTNRGIMNSICSKNDSAKVRGVLKKVGIWDYFIFPKISWKPKGQIIKSLLEEVQLRAPDVLFIDDNHLNLEEVKYYNPEINVSHPDIIPMILDNEYFSGKDDNHHSRLKKYKILEQKKHDAKNFVSNNDFLKECAIELKFYDDCINYVDRITELIERTNQLNYTKVRIHKKEVVNLINDPSYTTQYIKLKDRYGDYGVIGFYALKNGKLEHFFFSCSILNLGVPQFVYAKLGYPTINIKSPVAEKLKEKGTSSWISEVFEFSNFVKVH